MMADMPRTQNQKRMTSNIYNQCLRGNHSLGLIRIFGRDEARVRKKFKKWNEKPVRKKLEEK